MNRREIDGLSWRMSEVYADCVDKILVNLARHFQFIKEGEPISNAWKYQIRKLAEMDAVTQETAQIILNTLGGADKTLQGLLIESIQNGLKDAEPTLRKAAEKGLLKGPVSQIAPNQMQAFRAYYRQSADKLNLVNTVMLDSTQNAYRATVSDIASKIDNTQGILNTSTGEVITGVNSFNRVQRDAVRRMVDNGLTGFIDHGGHHWSPEAYVAMDMRTTMSNTARAAVFEQADEFGVELYQVSHHNGARPLCYPWQGKVISRNGWTGEVQDDEGNPVQVHSEDEIESFQYGGGLFGVNCGHYPIPFIPGFSRIRPPEQDEKANAKEYAESQQQRALERNVRNEKRELEVMRAQGADKADIDAQKTRVKEANADLDQFCKDTGRARRPERTATPINATFPDGYKQTYYERGVIRRNPNTPTTAETPVQAQKKEPETLKDTLANAYENHRTREGLTSTPYDPDSPFPVVKEDVSILGKESQETLRETIGELTGKYDTPLTDIHTMDRIEAIGNRDAFAYVSHNYENDTAKMVINPVKCKDEGKLIERLKELREKGYCANVPDEVLSKYVYTHEFGHTFISMRDLLQDSRNFVGADYEKIRRVRKEVSSVFAEYRDTIRKYEGIKKDAEKRFMIGLDAKAGEEAREAIRLLKENRISLYSLTNADEFFAEAFVYTEYGGTGNVWANRIRNIIDANFRR